MSKTNQVCITCTQRDTCQYYDPNRTLCVPVKVSDYGRFAGSLQPTIDWQQVHIQAAIAVLQGITPEWGNNAKQYAEWAVQVADALVAELKRSEDVYAECRRMTNNVLKLD